MKNITEQFNAEFIPVKALLIFKQETAENNINGYNYKPKTEVYVESYDIGKNGKPINAHPLSLKEIGSLADVLQSGDDFKHGYLKSRNLLPANVLYLDQQRNGFAVWYTPPQDANLLFIDALNVPSGKFKLPALVWKAHSEKLSVYALKGKNKPNEKSKLYHAPFLNTYANGLVCMGTVNIAISKSECLENFMRLWQEYFFNSYFSHSINGNSTTLTDTTILWRTLAKSGADFPLKELKSTGYTIKDIIS
ncbi:PRTRC system protein B [Mucilaginibacter ginkgonis]|uniref:Uncharacterized protein n=1 Tax=Mucilaginibacter ginkgonis TaxID=2682091 RepID=A0A6I4HVN2_9SPHI|nr:PRTRC system protein B [Mucilaginibacter ginkgonis]QQL50002.1 hypothetical protein GO620_000700 [Mucilaginibacter ginkgonis]